MDGAPQVFSLSELSLWVHVLLSCAVIGITLSLVAIELLKFVWNRGEIGFASWLAMGMLAAAAGLAYASGFVAVEFGSALSAAMTSERELALMAHHRAVIFLLLLLLPVLLCKVLGERAEKGRIFFSLAYRLGLAMLLAAVLLAGWRGLELFRSFAQV